MCTAARASAGDIPLEKFMVQKEAKSYNSLYSSFPVQTKKDLETFLRNRKVVFSKLKEGAETSGIPFELQAALIIERLPVILPDMEDWETEFRELQVQRQLMKFKEYSLDDVSVPTNRKEDEDWVYDILTFGTRREITPMAVDQDLASILKRLGPVKIGLVDDVSPKAPSKVSPVANKSQEGQTINPVDDLEALVEHMRNKSEQNEVEDDTSELQNSRTFGISEGEIFGQDVIDDLFSGDDEWQLPIDDASMGGSTNQTSFVPEPRITEADEMKDMKSLRRKLARRLHLIVRAKSIEEDSSPTVWRFPTASVDIENEFMLKAAKRITAEQLGTEMDVYFLTRAPAGVTYNQYSQEEQKKRSKFGGQIFFYRGQRVRGDVKIKDPSILEHAWITSDDLEEYVPDHETDPYWSYARMFMDD